MSVGLLTSDGFAKQCKRALSTKEPNYICTSLWSNILTGNATMENIR